MGDYIGLIDRYGIWLIVGFLIIEFLLDIIKDVISDEIEEWVDLQRSKFKEWRRRKRHGS